MNTTVKLGDVIQKIEESEFKPLKAGYERFVKVEHLDAGNLKIHRWGSIKDDLFPPTFHRVFRKGQILFPTRNPHLRRVVVADFDGICGEKTLALSPIENKIEPSLVPFIFQSDNFVQHCINCIIGSTNPHVRWRDIAEFKIDLPEGAIQKKIAKILWSIEFNLERLEQLTQITEKLKKGYLEELLTKGIGHTKFKKTELGEIPQEWEVRKVAELFTVETGTTPSTQNKEYWTNGTIEWFTPVDLSKLRDGNILDKSERKISEEAYDESSLTKIPKGSLIMSTRAPVGYVGLTSSDCTFNQGCKGLVPKKADVLSKFYLHYFLFIRSELERNSGGSTFKELSKSSLEKIRVVSVPKEEQERIFSIIDSFDKTLDQSRHHRELSYVLKRKLTGSFLSGELLEPKEVRN